MGGRTGLTAVVVGILFLLVIFPYVAAGEAWRCRLTRRQALIYVGVLMTSAGAGKLAGFSRSVPARLLRAVMMPFGFSIAKVSLGFISYCVMKIGAGARRATLARA